MSPSTKKGALFAHCDACNTDFSVAHTGVNDVKKHIATKHRDSLKAVTGHQSLTTLFRSDMVDQVTRAEVPFANFLTEHNLSFMTADH